ncbi:MAG TPA: hypothetical protein VHF88_02445 [Thermoleophilaceae bacterium]|nr:hypothetical protein [Thermoleophilaceae bacterium]
MSVAVKIPPLCAAALASITLASSAWAQEPVALEHEGGAHCDISTNPCQLTAHGEWHISSFGFIIFICEDEFTAQLGEDGKGHTTSATIFDHSDGGDCPRVPCNGVGESSAEVEWDIVNARETAPGETTFDRNLCIDAQGSPNATGTHCSTPMSLRETQGTHHYSLSMAYTCPNGIRLEGDWAVEGTPIEVAHDAP